VAVNNFELKKARVGGAGVIRDKDGNVKQEFTFQGETTFTEQELRQKLNMEQKDGSYSHNGG